MLLFADALCYYGLVLAGNFTRENDAMADILCSVSLGVWFVCLSHDLSSAAVIGRRHRPLSSIAVVQVEAKMSQLKQEYDEKLTQKEDLRKKAEHTELMLDRASKLVSGLAGERERWEITVKVRGRGRGRGEGGEREEEGERELMLDRASKLVSGLAGERERWEITVKVRGGDEGGEREGRGRRRGRGN